MRLAFADRLILHDQSLLGRNRDAILGDEEAWDGENEVGTRSLPFNLDARVIHEYLGAYYLLRWNRQVGTRRCIPRTLFAQTSRRRNIFSLFFNTEVTTRLLLCFHRYIAHLWRRGKRRLMKRYRLWLYKRQQKREQNLLKEQQSQAIRPNATAGGLNRVPGGECLPSHGMIKLGLHKQIYIF